MTRRMADQGPGLFDWAASQPVAAKPEPAPVTSRKPKRQPAPAPIAELESIGPAPVVDFLAKRDTLPRRILNPPPPFVYLDRQIARKHGIEPPAPILAFAPRSRPPDTSPDSGAPERRTG